MRPVQAVAALCLFLSLLCLSACAQEKVIRLYDGPAPGSEDWQQTEQESRLNLWMTHIVYNVANPTLTVFSPPPGQANGTAIVICPGGAFFALSIDTEGYDVARWLAAKGVTCFVLKYRLVRCRTADPTVEVMTRGPLDKVVAPVVRLALADANAAVGYVRRHAAEYGVKSHRIGIIGFSAGGTVAVSAALNHTPETRPDFAAPIYPDYDWAVKSNGVPKDAPPVFVLAASDDPLGLAPQSIQIYQEWIKAGKSAELHLYAQGGHGFGMRQQNLPSDHWTDPFANWLGGLGMMKQP